MTALLFYLDSLKDILSNLSVNITCIAVNLKFGVILFRRRNILDVNTWVDRLDTRASSAQEQECLRSAVQIAHKMFYLTCVMFTGAVILGEFGALLSHGKAIMFPAWYPFDWEHSSWKYLIVHVHQTIVSVLFVLQNVSNDTFPAIYMLVLTSHVKTLNIRIRRLGLDAAESWQDTSAELIQCIKDQQMLVAYFQTVRKITSTAIFLQFFVTGMEACITAVCVFCVEGDLFEIMFLAEYFLCVILEILLDCYFGEQLAGESERMTDAIYSCNWTDKDKTFKKNLIIFMQSTQENMTIVAGEIFLVNLTTFVSVLKQSYSLFAVLMSMT
ncbi:unnamed protein product [Hermetia illucens]|uniref:Odorant receptor n=2 Tax=Hermetia illucens TaxID=343691 RepID=A0A7R8URL4_HERIL|nr:unnamed protein product [Hermetia illucens]